MVGSPERRLQNLDSEIREKLRHVEYMSCYSVAVVRLVRKRHFYAKILVAVAGCIPFMAKLQNVSGETASWIAALVPLVAVALPIWNPDRLVEVGSTLHGRYAELIPPLRRLWRQIRDILPGDRADEGKIVEEAYEQLAAVEEQLASFHGEIAQLPDIGSVKERCAGSIPKYDEPYVVYPSSLW
jgi:hypothetical protein